MNKFLKISVIMLFVIALLITGGILMSKDKKPLHEQIAEYTQSWHCCPFQQQGEILGLRY